MQKLGQSYAENVELIDGILRVDASFDMLKKVLTVGSDELTLYYIDGFVKDGIMQKLLMHFISLDGLGDAGEFCAERFVRDNVVYVEAECTESVQIMVRSVMSGATLILGSKFGSKAIIVDARTYPARETAEPEGDKVMRGARDGFVETLIFNTALIRRRIRDPRLTMSYISIGRSSMTDVALCYVDGKADAEYVKSLEEKLKKIDVESLTLGHQSLAECLIKRGWFNPFPKIRTTERPDAAAAQLMEGSVLIICDNSPEVMILPTGILDFLQESNDFYFPPLTGSFLRIIRHIVFWLTLFMVPAWYLLIQNPELIPGWLDFIVPVEVGKIPIFAQILLVEFVIDALRMASMNTPDMLSNSLSVVGGLILGDFAVSIGWLIPEVILYMSFVAIANFTQRSYELGYALKYMRIILLVLTAIFDVWGFVVGALLCVSLIALNTTVNGKRRYLYPLIPFNARALKSLIIRVKKND